MAEHGHQAVPLARGGEDEEEVVVRPRPRQSILWSVFGRRVPRSEIVFFSQILIIYTVISVSLYNLTSGNGKSNLWIALLASCLGYLLPNPSIDLRETRK